MRLIPRLTVSRAARCVALLALIISFPHIAKGIDGGTPNIYDVVPAAEVEALIARLDDRDPAIREAAALRLKNLPGSAHPAVKAARQRPGLDPQAKAYLDAAAARTAPRARELARQNADTAANLQDAIEAYNKVGSRNEKWDEAARRAITEYTKPQVLRTPEGPNGPRRAQQALLAQIKQSIDAGCDDPYLQYLHCRVQWTIPELERGPLAARYRQAIYRLAESKYPQSRRMHAAFNYAHDTTDYYDPILHKLVDSSLASALKEPMSWGYLLDGVSTVHNALRKCIGPEESFKQLLPIYKANRPADDPGPLIFEGRVLIDLAWDARGRGSSDTVTDQGWKLFNNRLSAAAQALDKAWALDHSDARAATLMVTVLMGQDASDEEVQKWFNRAAVADPDDIQGRCDRRLTTLLPRWGGSYEAMLSFGRSMAAEGNWRGGTSFQIVNVHPWIAKEMRDPAAYMARPSVWADVKRCYDGFLALYPQSISRRNRFARLACECGQWPEADRIFRQIGDEPDLEVFTSQAVYDYFRNKAANLAAGQRAETK